MTTSQLPSRGLLAIVMAAGIALIGFMAGAWAGDPLVGLAAAAAFAVLLIAGTKASRRVAESRARKGVTGDPAVEALLDYSCLPGDWPQLAPETQRAVASGAPMPVTISASDGVLRVEQRPHFLITKFPFVAEAPLSSIERVDAGASQMMLGGSSLTFVFTSGQELRVDLKVGRRTAGDLALVFQSSARSLPGFHPARGALEVLSEPPPARTPRGVAHALVMVCFGPFLIAMVGAADGLFAAVTTGATLIVATALEELRPFSARTIIGKAMVVVSLAFVTDAILTGQLLRLTGTVVSLAIAAFLLRPARPPQ